TVPPAPGLPSTIACWPKRSPSCAAIRRAMMSTGPPGVKPWMMRIGLAGYSCANAGACRISAHASQAMRLKDIAFRQRAARHGPVDEVSFLHHALPGLEDFLVQLRQARFRKRQLAAALHELP